MAVTGHLVCPVTAIVSLTAIMSSGLARRVVRALQLAGQELQADAGGAQLLGLFHRPSLMEQGRTERRLGRRHGVPDHDARELISGVA